MFTALNKIKELLHSQYDVFITSASYEDRCLSITNAIINDIAFSKKIVSVSVPHKKFISENLQKFYDYDFKAIEVNNSKQIETVNNLLTVLNDIILRNSNASFLIDITTFTRQTLLILLRILRNILTKTNKIQFIYTPAKEYSIGLPYKDKWLTRGILEVNSVFGYSGVIRPSNPYHLVILMGYEVERASALINAYEPSKISVGFAKKHDSISDEYFDLNVQKIKSILSEFPYAEPFEFSCIKIDECKNDILTQINSKPGNNTIVSPMNNKISTISCGLAAFDNDEIQLAIAIPAIYNHENYSIPSANCHLFEIPNFIKDINV